VAVTNELPDQPIETDVHLLERIIMNLVRNSIEACSSGSTINIGARQNDETELVFNVADDGPGIPEEEMSRIFDPYVSSRRSGSGGAGLGLTICRKIVWALGGSITVQLRESGAEFEVVVPIAAKSNGLREQRI
jgi:signal transduction histidine kinase